MFECDVINLKFLIGAKIVNIRMTVEGELSTKSGSYQQVMNGWQGIGELKNLRF
jgi:hypothetical protein